jgi:hypothetical protein
VPELRRTRQKAKFAFWGFSEVRYQQATSMQHQSTKDSSKKIEK